MARTRITNYKFTPGVAGAGTVIVPGRINADQLLLIVNMSHNSIIYNFGDATRGFTSLTYSATGADLNIDSNYDGTTTITLDFDTSAMTANDRLSIYVEDIRESVRIRPNEILTDPVDKMRVSTPQSLIDTDFEYSVQPTKWEQLLLVQNYQSIFPKGSGANAYDISALTGDGTLPYSTMTLTTGSPHGLSVGDIITIQETTNQLADGTFIVQSVGSATTATYFARGPVSGSVFSTGLTLMTGGGIYDGSGIPVTSASTSAYTLTTRNLNFWTATPTATASGNITPTATGGTTANANVYMASTAGISTGMLVTGTGIANGAYVTSIFQTPTPGVILSATNAGTVSGTLNFSINTVGSRAIRLSSLSNVFALYSGISGTGITGQALVLETVAATGNIYINQTLTVAASGTYTANTNGVAGATTVTVDTTANLYVNVGVNSTTGIAAGTYATAIIGASNIRLSANTTAGVTSRLSLEGANIAVVTTSAHGLNPGTTIAVIGTTASTFNPPNGNWVIEQVPTPTIFYYRTPFRTSGTITFGAPSRLYTRPEGYIQHRSLDGGVQITTGSNLTGNQAIRQTRRYFRYQSGKGLQYSTGTKFTPSFDVDLITASGTTANVTTFQDHNLVAGVTILVENVEVASGTNFYNGTFTVTAVTSSKNFTYTMSGTPTDTTPGGTEVFVTCTAWKGATVRAGLFDEQSGFYYEFDGNVLYAARRQAIKELFGKVTATNGSGTITGTGTRFRRQLLTGDKIVIKGQTYEVAQIASDTSLAVNPVFRGNTSFSSQVKYTKVQNFKWPQAQWNVDKCDGTGPSGYTLNIAKMQMAYIDYTWYGAGFVRFGFRGPQGDIIIVHKVQNNNINVSAYMRSGNLPARFETYNFGRFSRLVSGTGVRGAALTGAATTMWIEDAELWPSSGYVVVNDGANVEIIQYASIGAFDATAGGYPLQSLTRRATLPIPGVGVDGVWSATAYNLQGTNASVTFTPDAGVGGAGTAQVGVVFLQTTCAPVVSHWGVSVIMDGRYDQDKEVRFTAGMLRYLSCQAGVRRPLLAIRIAPSVDSGIGRSFGVRELVNRMQLTLKEVGIYSQGQFLIEGILNPANVSNVNIPTAWTVANVGSGSLAQVIYWNNGDTYATAASTAGGTITGGDRIFGFYTENSGGNNFSATRAELQEVRDLGTSILSGDGSVTSPSYPNAPDMLVICATLLEATGTKNIACRLAWTEAQA